MVRNRISRNSGQSGRITVSGNELDTLDLDVGDEVEVGLTDAKEVAHALIDSKTTDRFLLISPT